MSGQETAAALPTAGERWAFFFDIDGTLLELAETPSGVRVDGELVALIRRLHDCAGGAVALRNHLRPCASVKMSHGQVPSAAATSGSVSFSAMPLGA